MKTIFILFALILTTSAFGQPMTWAEWSRASRSDIRLLPKYGGEERTPAQISADKEFTETVLQKYPNPRKASTYLIRLGFRYLYEDPKTAMYRFNQAYLLDSTNTDIYWGYGALYMLLGASAQGEAQFAEGLRRNPENTHLLTDYGTYFLGQFYELQPVNEDRAAENLDQAISYLSQSYALDSTDQNTTYKLSIVHWNKGNCDKAWLYYDACKALGGRPITEYYTKDLEDTCKREED